jgi:N-carbamoylputrescine amidase
MAASGVEVIFLPHASPRGDAQTKHQSWMRHLSARAFDNSTFIVACNQIGDNGGGLQFPGNAVVIDPSGIAVENRLEDSEGLLLADLKASALQRVRNHPMRYFFPNRRTDIYQ